jgi:protein-L-isoaspartate O-methyltransferase
MEGLTVTSARTDTAASGPARLHELLSTGDRAAWATAALALVAGAGGTPELRRSAEAVLDALGISLDPGAVPGIDRAGVAGQAAAPLLQTSALLTRGELWVDQPDEAIIAQGRASAQGAAAFERLGLPFLAGLAEALATPGARMLDVGTGVAALAASYAELFPELTVVGIDVLPRVLALAEDLLRTSPVADRVVLREQDVSGLSEEATYVLAWLPAPFVPEEAVRAGVPRIVRSLVPGGWLVVGHGKFAGEPLDDALTRFKTVSYGGTPLTNEQAQTLLGDVGLVDVATVQTPVGAPAITVGRRTPAP